jgi:hypothetical protein
MCILIYNLLDINNIKVIQTDQENKSGTSNQKVKEIILQRLIYHPKFLGFSYLKYGQLMFIQL